MANAVEASASTARPRKLKKGQRRVKRCSKKGRSPARELSENEKGRVQQTPEERTSDRDLEVPSSATVPTIPYQGTDTGEGIREEHKEKTDERRSLRRWTRRNCQADCRTPKCSRRGGKRECKKREE